MKTEINNELIKLRTMTPAMLREKYVEVFGEASRSGNKDFLCKRIAWRIQSLSEGTLSDRARKRAAEIARDADIRTTIPRAPTTTTETATITKPAPTSPSRLPMPGTVLTKDYRGTTYAVTVLRKGFEWNGQVFRSLSAVAKAITGTHWNGYLFFGLNDRDEK